MIKTELVVSVSCERETDLLSAEREWLRIKIKQVLAEDFNCDNIEVELKIKTDADKDK